jgi:penicillin-binding protein 2B
MNRIKLRAWFLGGVFTFLFFLLTFRLFWIQTVNAAWLMKDAQAQWERNVTIEPKRGTIFDRNGELLAYTAKAYTVIAKLKPWDKNDEGYVQNSVETGQKLASILGMPAEKIAEIIENARKEDRTQVEIRPGGWKLDEEKAQKVSGLKLPGIILYEDKKRYYPNDSFSSHILGFVDLDGKPMMGIEKVYDDVLKGEKGEYKLLKDRKGYKLPDGTESFTPAKNGNDVYLTIDYQIQNYVEDALNTVSKQVKARALSVIVADPHTGDILAMANRPSFNPNDYKTITNWTNFAISGKFEPGSTFKIVTLAAAIQEGLYHNNESYKSGSYFRKELGVPVNDYNKVGWGTISFLHGVQQSSNVLFTILGYERLGKDKLYDYIEKFGFGKQTGIGLPGEEPATLKDKSQLYPRDVASMTFGQGVAVTAIQQVAAVGAVANGGELLKPHIVKEIRNTQTGEVMSNTNREVVRRVVSEDTAKQVRDILETVVTDGTGKWYDLPGYHVAGKTGTAQVVGDNGKYQENKYIFSFIGFAPKDDPKLLVYVVADQPEVEYANGAKDVVAPIFKSVMQNSLQYLKVKPDENAKEEKVEKAKTVKVPDVMGKTGALADQSLSKLGLKVQVVGDGSKVEQQYPPAGEDALEGSTVYVVTAPSAKGKVPDFTGKSLREVLEYGNLLGIKININGTGYVVSQSVAPGTPIDKNQPLTVNLATKSNKQEEEQVSAEISSTQNKDPVAPSDPKAGSKTESPSKAVLPVNDAQPAKEADKKNKSKN